MSGSSKFGKNSAVQQPPPVCQKGPDELPILPTPLYRRTLQAYVFITEPVTPGGFLFSGIGPVFPQTPAGTWLGDYRLDGTGALLTLTSPDPFHTWTVQLDGFKAHTQVAQHIWTNVLAQTLNPFTLPQLNFLNYPASTIFQATIME